MTEEYQIKHWYENQKAIVRLTGSIENASIFDLCDEIDLAVDYYHFPTVEIQLDSPGGVLDSLKFYLKKRKEWQDKKVRIETQGLTEVASAAALILSTGDVGYRKVYSNTWLLYHQSRLPKVSNLTVYSANEWMKSLQSSNAEMINILAHHVWVKNEPIFKAATPPITLESIKKKYVDLFDRNQGEGESILADEAVAYWLVDVITDRKNH